MKKENSPAATLFAVSVAGFLMPFMLSGVGIALPSMGREFGANAVELGLVETGYMVSVSIFLLAMGRLADIHGRRRMFTLGIALFTAIAGLLAFSWSVEAVIGLRFVQGVGGAMVAATGPAIVVSVYPASGRGRALGISIAAIYAGLSCGPVIGGIMVSALGWRSLFLLVVPLGLAVLWMIRQKLHGEWADAKGEPFDWKGSLIYGAGLMVLVYGAANLSKGSWAWSLLAAGTFIILIFLLVEWRTPYPVLDVRLLLENRVFALSNLAALLNYAATFGVTFFMSLHLQYIMGLTPHHAGLVLMAQPLTQAALSPACGKLADRTSASRVATAGMALGAAGLAAAAFITESTGLPTIVAILVALGVGFALFSSPNTSVIMGSVASRHLGVASGFSSSMRTLGMMTSMTIITIILSVYMGGSHVTPENHPAFLNSMRTGFLVYALLCGAGILCSLGRLEKRLSPA